MNRDRFLGVDRDMRISLKLFLEVVIKRKYILFQGRSAHFNPLLEKSSSPARLPQTKQCSPEYCNSDTPIFFLDRTE